MLFINFAFPQPLQVNNPAKTFAELHPFASLGTAATLTAHSRGIWAITEVVKRVQARVCAQVAVKSARQHRWWARKKQQKRVAGVIYFHRRYHNMGMKVSYLPEKKPSRFKNHANWSLKTGYFWENGRGKGNRSIKEKGMAIHRLRGSNSKAELILIILILYSRRNKQPTKLTVLH